MSITYIPPRVPSVEGFLREDGTIPLSSEWDTGNFQIKGPSAVYASSTEPTTPYDGMLWNDTSVSTRQVIKKWTGTAWAQIGGVESSNRTISLVHDHEALLTPHSESPSPPERPVMNAETASEKLAQVIRIVNQRPIFSRYQRPNLSSCSG